MTGLGHMSIQQTTKPYDIWYSKELLYINDTEEQVKQGGKGEEVNLHTAEFLVE